MGQDWSNPNVARAWDRSGDNRNPVRSEQLDILLSLVEQTYQGGTILDLGYGSGKVEQLLFDRLKTAKVVGVDNSEAMMALARERLSPYQGQFESVVGDLAQLATLNLPEHTYSHVIAIQSLHHLSMEEMQEAYRTILHLLSPGGIFLLLDRMQVETEGLWSLYHIVWQRLDEQNGSTVAPHEGTDFDDHLARVQSRGDRPVLLSQHLSWLQETGFEAACLHAHGNRALIVGMKPQTLKHVHLAQDGDEWVLVLEQMLNHSPGKVWAALTEADRISSWGPCRPSRNLTTVGEVRLEPINVPEADDMEGYILEVQALQVLAYRWGTDILRWELGSRADGQTSLILRHRFKDRNQAPSYAAGWHLCNEGLIGMLEGKEMPSMVGMEAMKHGWNELYQKYAKQLGVTS